MTPDFVREEVDHYLERVDRALPGRLEGFYLVGSTALGAFRPGRSDIDFVGVVGSALSDLELRRLRATHASLYRRALVRAMTRIPWHWPLMCNGVLVQWEDIARSPARVAPIAAHSSGRFEVGRGFDVNPVTWWVLGSSGIAIRGPESGALDVYRNGVELRTWTRTNLDTYWRGWAHALAGRGLPAATALLSHYVAWGVLGAARMLYTIQTGEVASKERAGRYALDVCAARWHPLIRETLAYWKAEKPHIAYRTPVTRRNDAAAFVHNIVEVGNA